MVITGARSQEKAASNEGFCPLNRASPNPGQISFLRTYPWHRRRQPPVWAWSPICRRLRVRGCTLPGPSLLRCDGAQQEMAPASGALKRRQTTHDYEPQPYRSATPHLAGTLRRATGAEAASDRPAYPAARQGCYRGQPRGYRSRDRSARENTSATSSASMRATLQPCRCHAKALLNWAASPKKPQAATCRPLLILRPSARALHSKLLV